MTVELLEVPVVGTFLRWKHARTALQTGTLVLAALVILDGLVGPTAAHRNAAGTLPWVHWRGFMVLALLLAGNLFCMACPFMLPRRVAKGLLPGDRPVPRWLRGKWVAVALMVVFFWAYEAFDLWASPWLTAWVVLAYFAGAFVVDGLFRGAAFCKHVCPIGQFNFVNGLVSPTEVRVRDPEVCGACTTKDCIRGRWEPGAGPGRGSGGGARAIAGAASPLKIQSGCELWLYQPLKVGNMDCTFCMECIQACPWDNVGIVYRTPGADLTDDAVRSGVGRLGDRTDLAALALVVTFAAFVNAFGMVAPVRAVEAWMSSLPGLGPGWAALAATFALGLVGLPLLLVAAAAGATRALSGSPGSLVDVVTRYAWCLVPVGFGMWLAHYLLHFVLGGLAAVAVLLARTPWLEAVPAWWPVGSMVPEGWLLPIQLVALEGGALGSVWAAHRIARRDVGPGRPANRAFLPWAVLAVALSLLGMWLLTRPMEMRGMAPMPGMAGG